MSNLNQIAAERLLQRRRIRASLGAWGKHIGFDPSAKHHQLIIRKLEAAARGEIRRLAIFLPPGSAKSTWANKLYVPWYLSQQPGRCILAVSHSDTKAESFGRFSRNLVAANADVLGYHLKSDSKAAGEWETTNGGLFFCAGVGKGIAGYRADFGLIDDPIGKKQDAQSKTIRDGVWDWYNADFKFRLKPGAIIVLIQTRWHEDDLAGRILSTESGWEVISIPLIAEENDVLGRSVGEPLWPEFFTPDHIKGMVENPDFVPMCQQRPTPESGELFKKEWIEDAAYHSESQLPLDELRYYVGSDHAVSERTEGDRTCIVPAGVDARGDIWVLPSVWWPRTERPTSDVVIDEMFRICRMYRPAWWWAGKEQIVTALGPIIEKLSVEEGVFVPIDPLPDTKSKQVKAESIRGFCKRGRVHLPAFAPWYADARDELLRFDKGTHDDFVDALACLGRGLAKQVGHKPAKPVVETLAPPVPTLGWVRRSHETQSVVASGM